MFRTILLLLALALAGTASQKTKKLTCGFPGSPAHGHVRPDKAAYSEGDLVSFGCRVGHILLGSHISRCTENGSWTEGIPICDDSMTTLGGVTATPTVPGQAAELAIDGNKDSCTYLKPRTPRWWRTDLGGEHKVLSVAVTTSTMDKYARFSVFVFNTQEGRYSSKTCAFFDGKIDTPTMVLSCEEGGIVGKGVSIKDYIETEGLFEICEIEVQVEKDTGYDCGKPNRKLHSVTFEPQNDTVQYGCIKGYELKGSEFRHCLSTGQWSGEAPECILQMQDHDIPPFSQLTEDTQLADLQKNISALWSYIYELRGAVTNHLNHLRQHQIEMEETIHRLEHHGGHSESHGDSHASHTAGHSHSGENHASHTTGHSHSGEDHHHHSDEHHSHGGDDHGHTHSGEHQSHGHYHDSHSHSHTDGDHAHGDDHSHGHAHKDSHENADDLQQTSQVSEPLVEPVIVASTRRPSNYPKPHSHHHHQHSSGGSINLMGEDSHHFHHTNSRSRSKNVTMPKYSEYDLYEYAVCNVLPNKGLSVEQQQNVVGTVAFWQKKTGGPLNIHLRLTGFSMGGDHHAHHQQAQQQEDDHVDHVPAQLMQHRHGFHVHADADITNGCQGCGPHYNPKGVKHGGPKSLVRHVGDFGNIECDEHGIANLAFSDGIASLKGPYSIVGKSLVVHAGEDDLGLGGDDESLKTGNAGARLACCVIEKIDKLPFRSYKAMKTAIQYQN